MNTYSVTCLIDSREFKQTVIAEKSYVDSVSGTLRFYNTKDKHSVAQFAKGFWTRFILDVS